MRPDALVLTYGAPGLARTVAAARDDVVLLDERTVVTPGWLDKLRRCAASDSSIAAITPMIVDPRAADAESAARAIERAALPLYPDVSGAPQACLYLRREWLRASGGLDLSSDGQPAVSEFLQRARDAGYRTVLCDDACVLHASPHRGDVAAIGPLRRMLRSQLALARDEGKPGVLHVVHPRGGGTEKHIRELIAATEGEYRHYFLRVCDDRWLFREAAEPYAASYAWPRDERSVDCLRTMSAWLRIGLVHVHSLVGSGDDFLQLLASASLPYCYSVHDMYLPCPSVYLIDSRGEYCNATTDPAACRKCLAGFPGLADVDIERWRARYAAFLGGAAAVYAPSRWAGETLRKYYPDIRLAVMPHSSRANRHRPLREGLALFPLPEDACRHVAVLGAIGPEKGARALDALASLIRERRLPLRIVVLGYNDRAFRLQSDDKVLTIHGQYRHDEIEALFDAYRIALAVFPTTWPETFSYTLGEAWMAGRPALVPARGALMERVVATGAGWLMEGWPPSLEALADQLVALTSPDRAAELAAKGALARAAFEQGVREVPAAPYRGLVPVAPDAERLGTRRDVYEAACRAMGFAPLDAPVLERATPRARDTAFTRLTRLFRG
jgi:glycosyltransferase involved in cell wall biosynthesis